MQNVKKSHTFEIFPALCLSLSRGSLVAIFVDFFRLDAPELFQRLLDFQAQRFVPEPDDGERLLNCPTPGCVKMLVPVSLVEQKTDVPGNKAKAETDRSSSYILNVYELLSYRYDIHS